MGVTGPTNRGAAFSRQRRLSSRRASCAATQRHSPFEPVQWPREKSWALLRAANWTLPLGNAKGQRRFELAWQMILEAHARGADFGEPLTFQRSVGRVSPGTRL